MTDSAYYITPTVSTDGMRLRTQFLQILEPSFTIKDQVQPPSKPHASLCNATLDNLNSSLVVLTTNFSSIELVSRNGEHVSTNLVVSIIRPGSCRLFRGLAVSNGMVPQPGPHIAPVLSVVDVRRQVVCPTQGIGIGDVRSYSGRGNAEDGVRDRSVPGSVEIGLMAVEGN